MRSRVLAAGLVCVMGAALTATVPASAAPPDQPGKGNRLEVFVGQVDAAGLEKLKQAGLDHEDVSTGRGSDGGIAVEVVMSTRQAEKLAGQGVDLEVKRVKGKRASELAAEQNRAGYEGFRMVREDQGANA